MLVAAMMLPPIIEKLSISKLTNGNERSLLAIFQTRLIVRSALFEGPAFFALIAYILEGQWLALAIAGAMAVGIATGFPSVAGVEAWIEERRERIAAERSAP
jgi:hypothetical protein